MNNRNNNIKYILPGFWNFGINELLIKIYKFRPEITMKSSEIYSFFGTFPNALWNGGRPDIIEPHATIKKIKKVTKYYNNQNIKLTLTFTNPVIREEHLSDEYCNSILDIIDNDYNEVLVASELLENYIRNKHPNLKINKSILATEKLPCEISEKYNLTVLDKRKNWDHIFLKKIKMEDRKKVEILCNETCINDCKYTYQHYEEMGHLQLGDEKKHEIYGLCRYKSKIPQYKTMYVIRNESNYFISPKQIEEVFVKMGYEYFKICGREKYEMYGLESIVFYCIKPEYRADVRIYLIEKMLNDFSQDMSKWLENMPEYSILLEKEMNEMYD